MSDSEKIHKEIAQTLEKELLKKNDEIVLLTEKAEAKASLMQANTRSTLILIALLAPIILMVFLVIYDKSESVILAAVSYVSFLTGSITIPLIMNYFGIDSDIKKEVVSNSSKR